MMALHTTLLLALSFGAGYLVGSTIHESNPKPHKSKWNGSHS